MLKIEDFFKLLEKNRVGFFTGVPDSLLKSVSAYLNDKVDKKDHVIAANEGNAVALASGYHLASGKYALVYLQNSGLGNTVNPLVSIADRKVYSIPMLLLVGWRGEEGLRDEPQHEKQGEITLDMLKTLGIPYEILPKDEGKLKRVLDKAYKALKQRQSPFALVARKNTFKPYKSRHKLQSRAELAREEALEEVLGILEKNAVIVSTTGKLSRELFELRDKKGLGHQRDFLVVGGMGHASSVALGIALRKPRQEVYCFDGDGATIMHLGSLPVIGQYGGANFKHIVFNNQSHDSVGGQPTAAENIDFPSLAKACGYKGASSLKTRSELKKDLAKLSRSKGPYLLELKVKGGARKDLGRPTKSPRENKKALMKFLENE